MGARIGLDYTAVLAVARVLGIETAETFDYVRYLEIGAIAAYMGKGVEHILDG